MTLVSTSNNSRNFSDGERHPTRRWTRSAGSAFFSLFVGFQVVDNGRARSTRAFDGSLVQANVNERDPGQKVLKHILRRSSLLMDASLGMSLLSP